MEIDCYYYLPTLFFHATFEKVPQIANHESQGCIDLAQSWPQLPFSPLHEKHHFRKNAQLKCHIFVIFCS